MGSRSRKRVRGAEADELVRAELKPLAQGERPGAVTVAAVVATIAVPANLVAALVADRTTPEQWRFTILQCVVLAAAAYGCWLSRYWAVLGMQVLLALTCVIGFGTILLAHNVLAAVFGLVMVGLAGTLFWKLVRALARIQMPQRRPRAD